MNGMTAKIYMLSETLTVALAITRANIVNCIFDVDMKVKLMECYKYGSIIDTVWFVVHRPVFSMLMLIFSMVPNDLQ